VRKRPTTNGNGAQTPSSGLPLNGGGSPLNGGPGGGGQGPAAPGGSLNGSNLPAALPRGRDNGRGDRPGAAPGGGVGGLSSGGLSSGGVRKPGRMALSNWRVRWRLFAIITVPTVTALILGIIQNINAETSSQNFSRVQTMSQLGGLAAQAVGQLEDERDTTAAWIASGGSVNGNAGIKSTMTTDRAATLATLNQFKGQASGVVN
jgi:hypothetical protein